MISIKPTFWKLSNVIWAVFIGAFCLCPLALQSPTAPSSLAGLGTFVGLAVLCWLKGAARLRSRVWPQRRHLTRSHATT